MASATDSFPLAAMEPMEPAEAQPACEGGEEEPEADAMEVEVETLDDLACKVVKLVEHVCQLRDDLGKREETIKMLRSNINGILDRKKLEEQEHAGAKDAENGEPEREYHAYQLRMCNSPGIPGKFTVASREPVILSDKVDERGRSCGGALRFFLWDCALESGWGAHETDGMKVKARLVVNNSSLTEMACENVGDRFLLGTEGVFSGGEVVLKDLSVLKKVSEMLLKTNGTTKGALGENVRLKVFVESRGDGCFEPSLIKSFLSPPFTVVSDSAHRNKSKSKAAAAVQVAAK